MHVRIRVKVRASPTPNPNPNPNPNVRRRYAAWLDLVDDLGLVEIGLGVETGLGGVFKGQYKGQFTRREAPLCFELTYDLRLTTYHLPPTAYRLPLAT